MLHPEPLPENIKHVWYHFLDLHGTRGSSGFGGLPITYTEIHSWSLLMGVDLIPWEVQVIKLLDRIYLKKMAEEAAEKNKND